MNNAALLINREYFTLYLTKTCPNIQFYKLQIGRISHAS